MVFDITSYVGREPSETRRLIREGKIDFPTARMCRSYTQANLVILPGEYAVDFECYVEKNPLACPALEVAKESPETHTMDEGGNIRGDVPHYWAYENGVMTKELIDVSLYWEEGHVGFLIGCSFSFEETLTAARVPVYHIEMKRDVSMFKTNIQTEKVDPFVGPTVCLARPMTPGWAKKAYDITVKTSNVHGASV